MQIKNIEIKDIPVIASSYKKTFSREHFSVNFSEKLLEKYFITLVNNFNYNRILINNEKKLVGYLIGGKFPSFAVKQFIKKNLKEIIVVFIKNPRFIVEKFFEIINNIFNPNKEADLDENTLCLIATDREEQGKGFGKLLIEDFESLLKKNNYSSYYLAVRRTNIQAISFYEKSHFSRIKETGTMIYYKKFNKLKYHYFGIRHMLITN